MDLNKTTHDACDVAAMIVDDFGDGGFGPHEKEFTDLVDALVIEWLKPSEMEHLVRYIQDFAENSCEAEAWEHFVRARGDVPEDEVASEVEAYRRLASLRVADDD